MKLDKLEEDMASLERATTALRNFDAKFDERWNGLHRAATSIANQHTTPENAGLVESVLFNLFQKELSNTRDQLMAAVDRATARIARHAPQAQQSCNHQQQLQGQLACGVGQTTVVR
jgi:DNA repair exonuclease SbcCD ATPase subunit